MCRDGASTWIFILATFSVVGFSQCKQANEVVRHFTADELVTSQANEIPGLTYGFNHWGKWSECSCATASRTRSRSCRNLRACEGAWKESEVCRPWGCHVNGGWGEWSAYVCQATCGFSVQVRSRQCDSPPPAYHGMPCYGPTTEITACPALPACDAIHGGWGGWAAWGRCSVSCGGGTRFRSRACTNPRPQNGGRKCQGQWQGAEACNIHECAADPAWTPWGAWSNCDVTCGAGITKRSRSCVAKDAVNRGKSCPGRGTDKQVCSPRHCPVDGGWSPWASWSKCSATCGYGSLRTRQRMCDAPCAQHGGQKCLGKALEKESCAVPSCPAPPVDGGWSPWAPWSECSTTCGHGSMRTRQRMCDAPFPQHGGRKCQGRALIKESCLVPGCPVDGRYTTWSAWSACTATCGASATRSRTRTCAAPAPAHGGRQCAGPPRQVVVCHGLRECTEKVDGNWGVWGEWQSTVSCGVGPRRRIRYCNSPPASNGGLPCPGAMREQESFDHGPCPVAGVWGEWGWYTSCSATCGQGTNERTRSCDNPPPQHGGAECEGMGRQVKQCQADEDCLDTEWSVWSQWACSATCGVAVQTRSRTCPKPGLCPGGPDTEALDCSGGPCPVHGGWGQWSPWSCPVTCGDGRGFRSRVCDSPRPQHGGVACRGGAKQYRGCGLGACPVSGTWGEWSPWGYCNRKSCRKSRKRSCKGGNFCPGASVESKSCTCQVDGNWGSWGGWSTCSKTKTCEGTSFRHRKCNNPEPSYFGRRCVGYANQWTWCNGCKEDDKTYG